MRANTGYDHLLGLILTRINRLRIGQTRIKANKMGLHLIIPGIIISVPIPDAFAGQLSM